MFLYQEQALQLERLRQQQEKARQSWATQQAAAAAASADARGVGAPSLLEIQQEQAKQLLQETKKSVQQLRVSPRAAGILIVVSMIACVDILSKCGFCIRVSYQATLSYSATGIFARQLLLYSVGGAAAAGAAINSGCLVKRRSTQ